MQNCGKGREIEKMVVRLVCRHFSGKIYGYHLDVP